MQLLEGAGSSEDFRAQCKVLFVASFESCHSPPSDPEGSWVQLGEWGKALKLYSTSCKKSMYIHLGGHLCPGLQAFPGRWMKPTTLPHLQKVSQAQREGLSTRAVDPEPPEPVWVRAHSGEGPEEQGLCACALGTGGSRRLGFWSPVLGPFSSFDYSPIYNTGTVIG